MRYAVFVTGALAAALSAPSSAHAQLPPASQMAKLTASDGAVNDFFGESVSLLGSRALVGARIGGAGADNAGSAYVFERQSDSSWLEAAELTASDGNPSDSFGASVSLTGERALVGAPDDDTATDLHVGSAYVFERQPSGTWLEVAKLMASDGTSFDEFGNAVSLSGDRALVGASLDSTGAGAAAGSAYVFERQPSGTWLEVAKLTAGDAAEGHSFGRSVSLEGDRAFVGAIRSDAPAAASTGAAYVFERQTDGTWLQVAKLTASDAAGVDWFGSSVALEGQRALVGASLDDTTAIDAGSAYLFERQPSGTWLEVAKLTASDASEEDSFGSCAELSGDRALVGAATKVGFGPGPGAAYLYERQGDGTWPEVAILTAQDGAPGDAFGASGVSFDGDRILLGAYGDDALTGSAYVFRICDGCAVAVGTGTPGCNGAHALQPNLPPESGLASFALRCTNAPASSIGFLGLGNAANPVGSDPIGLGVLLHIDVFASTFLSISGISSDAAGVGSKSLPIPSDALLVGVTIVAQALWPWASCSLPPLGLSSSPGLAFTILAP